MDHRFRMVRRALAGSVAVIASMTMAACQDATGSGDPDVYGVWVPDDGSGTKTIEEDGRCSGMYYNNGEPLDIGGAMVCTVGDVGDDGEFTIVVEQPPNKQTYTAEFADDDTLVLSDNAG